LSTKKLIIALTGASGAVYGVRLLEACRKLGVETHLMISPAGLLTLHQEMQLKREELEALASHVHAVKDIGACVASGSFDTAGMIVAPCSMKTLASIAMGLGDNLITRSADVCLKERRRLVLMVRETPLNLAHLRNMTSVTEMGGIIFPPLPGFYHHPESIEAMVQHTIGRVLQLVGIEQDLSPAWQGM
jgi:4-hydroxy-3-polyprenylbenzoate decarboxylase